MAELTLEPYSTVQHWTFHHADARGEEILAAYMQALARRLAVPGQSVIGHIKALALFPEGEYLSLSVVTAGRPATIKGVVPDGKKDLKLTLNVLVYGMDSGLIARINQETLDEVTESWHVKISMPLAEVKSNHSIHKEKNHE